METLVIRRAVEQLACRAIGRAQADVRGLASAVFRAAGNVASQVCAWPPPACCSDVPRNNPQTAAGGADSDTVVAGPAGVSRSS